MGVLAWIAIGIARGVVWGALDKAAPYGGRAALYIAAAAGGVLGGLVGMAASSASVTTFSRWRHG